MPDFPNIEDLNSIGTIPEDEAFPDSTKRTPLRIGAKVLPADKPPPLPASVAYTGDVNDLRRGSIWDAGTPVEAAAIRRAVDGEQVVVDCGTQRELLAQKMRFYRCKRSLLQRGNRYVSLISFRMMEDRFLIIETQKGLEGKIVTDPEVLARLGIEPKL